MNSYLFACILGVNRQPVFDGLEVIALTHAASRSSGWIRAVDEALLRHQAAEQECDAIVLSRHQTAQQKRLLVMDFDSTLVTSEGLDMLAAHHGTGYQVARLTKQAMQGNLDFAQSLNSRLATLAGTRLATVDTLADQQPLQPGMRELVTQAQQAKVETAIISGGFDRCIAPIAKKLGINRILCNRFELAGDRLTGKVQGRIIDAQAKRQGLLDIALQLGIGPDQTMALGDGANDIPMLKAATIGIALHPKSALVRKNPNAIVHTSPAELVFLLQSQQFPDSENRK